MRTFERKDTANAENEIVIFEIPFSLFLISGETMEHSTRKLILIRFHHAEQFVLCFPTMNHQRQPCFHRPFHLPLERIELLLLMFSGPIEVQTHLTDSNIATVGHQFSMHLSKDIEIIIIDFLRLQSHHRVEIARIPPTQSRHTIEAIGVDGRNENLSNSLAFSPFDDLINV